MDYQAMPNRHPRRPGQQPTAAPTLPPTAITDDAVSSPAHLSDDEQKLLAYQVAEAAKQQIIAWAKWLAAVATIILAVLGFQFGNAISQIDTKIEKSVDVRVEALLRDKTKEIERLSQRMVDQHIESLVATRTEASKALNDVKSEARTALASVKRETTTAIDEFNRSRKEVARIRSVIIAQMKGDGTFTVTTDVGDRVKSDAQTEVVFGDLPDFTLGITGAGPGEMLLDALIDGRYGSPFARYFLAALENGSVDTNNDGRISVTEGVASAKAVLGASKYKQSPVIAGNDPEFAFLRHSGGQLTPAIKGQVFAVIIGIDRYSEPSIRLQGCVNDANDVKSFLLSNHLAETSNIDLLVNAAATTVGISNSIDRVVSLASADDVVLLCYSGHIVHIPNEDESKESQQRALCPVDLVVGNDKGQGLLRLSDIADRISKSKAKQTIILIP